MTDLSTLSKGIGDLLINLSSEYPVILSAILMLIAAAGVFICASGVLDITKMGRPEHQIKGSTVFWKLLGGSSLVDLSFFAKIWTGTLWAESNPLGISSYVVAANAKTDYSQQAMMAAMGIIVIAGYITLARAYFGISKLGSLSQESRSEMVGFIVSRIVAGSLMVAILHVAKLIDTSAGFNWIPT